MMNFNKLSKSQRCAFFATRRITVGKISQYIDRKFVDFYVGKIGGKIISRDNIYKFDNPEDAKKIAVWFKKDCKKEIEEYIPFKEVPKNYIPSKIEYGVPYYKRIVTKKMEANNAKTKN